MDKTDHDPQQPLLHHDLKFVCNNFGGCGQVVQYDLETGYMRMRGKTATISTGKHPVTGRDITTLAVTETDFDQWFPCRGVHVLEDLGWQEPPEALKDVPPIGKSDGPRDQRTVEPTAVREKLHRRYAGNRQPADHGARAATGEDFRETDLVEGPAAGTRASRQIVTT